MYIALFYQIPPFGVMLSPSPSATLSLMICELVYMTAQFLELVFIVLNSLSTDMG